MLSTVNGRSVANLFGVSFDTTLAEISCNVQLYDLALQVPFRLSASSDPATHGHLTRFIHDQRTI